MIPRPPHLPGSYLVVELTNRCSLACVHCSVSDTQHPHHQHTGYMAPALFDGLVDDLVATGARFDSLVLFWLGEPLIHPHFPVIYRRALRAAVQHGVFGRIEVHSNATHLDGANRCALLNNAAVPQVLHLSLDADNRDTYTTIKGMDRFDQVVANVQEFLVGKATCGARWPRPVFQFIVGSNNYGEARAFQDRWLNTCRAQGIPVQSAAGHVPHGEDAVVFFRQLDCPTPEVQEAENQVFRRAMKDLGLDLPAAAARGRQVEAENLHPCSGFWKSPVVGWQGDVTTCTRDNLLENRVGTIAETPFHRLWWGAEMAARRRQVAGGDYAGLPPCATCFIPRSLNHAELAGADISEQAAHDLAVGERAVA